MVRSAQKYREEAQRLRAIAARASQPEQWRIMLKAADAYDMLAGQVEMMAKRKPFVWPFHKHLDRRDRGAAGTEAGGR